MRIHRGAVVAVGAIDTLKRDEDGRTRVMLRDGANDDELIVSRRHVADVKRRLKKGIEPLEIRIATRKSELALWQAKHVAQKT